VTCLRCAKVALYRTYQGGVEVGFCRAHHAEAVARTQQGTAKLVGWLAANRHDRVANAARKAWKGRGRQASLPKGRR
jgi:hypothetical protein